MLPPPLGLERGWQDCRGLQAGWDELPPFPSHWEPQRAAGQGQQGNTGAAHHLKGLLDGPDVLCHVLCLSWHRALTSERGMAG